MRLDGCGRGRCTPAAFYLGLCRLRGILSLPASHDHAAGGLFFFAATKIGIGCGTRCRHNHCRRAILRCSYEDWNRMRLVVAARRLRQGQAGHSSLPQGKLESAAEDRCRHNRCRRAILLCCYENWKRTRNAVETTNSAGETLHRFPSLSLKSRITARKRA